MVSNHPMGETYATGMVNSKAKTTETSKPQILKDRPEAEEKRTRVEASRVISKQVQARPITIP